LKKKTGTTHLSTKFVKFANVHKVTRHITNLCRHKDFKTLRSPTPYKNRAKAQHTPQISNKYNTVLTFIK